MSGRKELKFETHSFGVECYSAGDLRVAYAGYTHHICVDRIGRKKFPFDDRRAPLGTLPGRVAFSGPVQIEWRTRDDKRYSHELDLGQIFKGKAVPHEEDPERIFQPAPFVLGGPAIIVEINGRTLGIYLDALIQLLPMDQSIEVLEQRRIRKLAYTKDF
jgi:hypothetical protein